jgi:ADP-heptose:LPS heptosyltransferase
LPGVRVEEIVPLRELASALDRASVVVSNDSGLAHFADACGVPVVVVHGSTTAELTGVGTGVDGGRLWCRPCYRKHCLWGGGCLERVKVESVEAAARAAMRIIVP